MSLTVTVSDIVNQSTSELLGKHQSWERVELGFIAKVLNGFAFDSANFSKERGIPLIRIRDISCNFTETLYDGSYDAVYLVRPNDLLVGMDGDSNSALWAGLVGLLNQRVCKIEVYEELFSKKLLSYVLPGYLDAINNVTSSMTVKHLSSKSIEDIPLPLPPLSEQNCIVAAIEQQFTRLDNAVASLQSAKARAKQYRASLLKAAVDGELTKEWRATHPTEETGAKLLALILRERRARWEEEQLAKMQEKPKDDKWKRAYKDPQGPDVEQLPELPDGWCWATVEQVAQIQGGIQKQPSRVPRQNAYPYLRVANVLRGKLDLSVIEKMELFGNELEALRLKSGDLLIVEGNGSKTEIGRSALWNDEIENCVHQNHIIRVRLNHVLPKFIDFYWNSPGGNQRVMEVAASTTGLYTLSVNKISRLPIPLPPLTEQRQIVTEVEARLSNIAQMEETIEASLKRAEHERQSILQEAFMGRLVPQDPEDEPASVLLERIREEQKRREEAEKATRANRKGIQMEMRRNRQVEKANLYITLVDAGHPLSPDELFKSVGLQADEQPESVEVFYEKLHAHVKNALIKETRPDDMHVLLEVLQPSAEVLAHMVEEKVAKQAQEVKSDEKGTDTPTLWTF